MKKKPSRYYVSITCTKMVKIAHKKTRGTTADTHAQGQIVGQQSGFWTGCTWALCIYNVLERFICVNMVIYELRLSQTSILCPILQVETNFKNQKNSGQMAINRVLGIVPLAISQWGLDEM